MHGKSIKCLGFTLVELMITVAIAAILLGIAIPSFTEMMQRNRLTTITNNFLTSLSYARNEAIKRGAEVTMINTGGDWGAGWNICVDGNTDNACGNAADTLLRTAESIPAGYSISTGASDYATYATFTANGLPTSAIGDTFTICDGNNSRIVRINSIGRARFDGESSC